MGGRRQPSLQEGGRTGWFQNVQPPAAHGQQTNLMPHFCWEGLGVTTPKATCLSTESHVSSLGLSSSPVLGTEAKQCLEKETDEVVVGGDAIISPHLLSHSHMRAQAWVLVVRQCSDWSSHP